MSEQSCCNFEVTKIDNGFRVEVTGCDCQEMVEKFLANCCNKEGESKPSCC